MPRLTMNAAPANRDAAIRENQNVKANYPRDRTALLLVDPYNDVLAEGGKLWSLVKEMAREVSLLANLRAIVAAVRRERIPVFIVPHHRWEPGDHEAWHHPTPYQLQSAAMQLFARDSWGGSWHPDFTPRPEDIIVKEHWGSSGFASTDLDLRLRQHGVLQLILIGMLANTCVETTGRFAVELGYHVTLVRDATAAFSRDRMRAAHELNGPTFAHAILSTPDLLAALAAA